MSLTGRVFRHLVTLLAMGLLPITPAAAVLLSPDPTFSELEALVKRPGIDSVETMLAALPVSYRNSFTLVYKSKSIQGASVEAPRAIVFGREGKLILTFNGEKSQKGFNDVEVLHWDHAQKNWELREIKFSDNGKAAVSEANPAHCLHCHTSSPRPYGQVKPVWDNYHRWTGVYGSVDDGIYNLKDKNEAGRVKPEEIAFINLESENFMKFRAKALSHSRYKYLYEGQAADPLFPYHYNDPFELNFKLGKAPNTRLTEFLAIRTMDRNVSRIMESEVFKKFPNSLFLLNQCTHEPQAQNALNAFVSIAKQVWPNGKISDLRAFDGATYQVFHQVIDLLGIVGIDEWNTALDTPAQYVTYPITGIWGSSPSQFVIDGRFTERLYKSVSRTCIPNVYTGPYKNEPLIGTDFLEIFNKIWEFNRCFDTCAIAAKKSAEELATSKISMEKVIQDSAKARLAYKKDSERDVVQTCAACHSPKSGPRIGPAIPFFGDRKKLKEWAAEIEIAVNPLQPSVAQGGHRMPFAQTPLNAQEIKTLLEYVRGE